MQADSYLCGAACDSYRHQMFVKDIGIMATTRRVLVTGSSGLIGSEAVIYFDQRGWDVHGVDNNMRRDFFGPDGDTTWNLERLRDATERFEHHDLDVRDRDG